MKKILRGHGTLGNDHPIAPSVPFWADLEQRTYDPDKARHHLKKAGYENVKLDLSAADAAYSGAVDAAVLMKEHLAKAGMDVNVVREPNDGYWSNVWMKKAMEPMLLGWSSDMRLDVLSGPMQMAPTGTILGSSMTASTSC